MRIPPHWAKETCCGQDSKGRQRRFHAWGWSFDSISSARADAAARARRIFEHFVSGTKPNTYDYLEHPLREEIVQSIAEGDAKTAVVTRNRYGSLVLNSAAVCFVDVDFPPAKSSGLVDALSLLFSRTKRQARLAAVQQRTVEKVEQWYAGNPQRSFRLYQTAAGLRMLMTDRLYDPKSAEVDKLFGELGCDALYRRLTQKQECFRARLTPKPWRCGIKRPPNRYPWDTADEERAYRQWQQNYESRTKGLATCRFIQAFGPAPTDKTIASMVRFHDRHACSGNEAALA